MEHFECAHACRFLHNVPSENDYLRATSSPAESLFIWLMVSARGKDQLSSEVTDQLF